MDLPPLLGRWSEQDQLQRVLNRAAEGAPQLVVLTGRRRVGKTFLLAHTASSRRSVYLAATQQAETVELGRLAEAVSRSLGTEALDLAGGALPSWEAALRVLAGLARREPLLVVLDEVGYLLRTSPGLASVLQAWWDHLPRPNHLCLVLTGSSTSTADRLLGPGAPLLGRPTAVMRLAPVPLAHASHFLPGAAPPTVVHAYAAGGGYPLHLLAWDPAAPVQENLLRLAGTPGGLLLEDAPGIVREEVSDAPGYVRILAAVAAGRTRTSQVADLAGQRVEQPLALLAEAGLLRREVPLGAPTVRHLGGRARWAVDDPYLRWYYRVLYTQRGLVEAGQGRAVLRRSAGAWADQVCAVFEQGAREHAAALVASGELPDCVIGRWWAERGEPAEVDVLGLQGARTALLGEARWQEAALSPRDLAGLLSRLPRLPDPVPRPVALLYGRSGADRSTRESRGDDLDVRTFDVTDVTGLRDEAAGPTGPAPRRDGRRTLQP